MKILLCFILSTAALINVQGRPAINYGTKANSCQFPFAATIYRELSQVCNGAIVSEFYILTAAHCFDGATKTQLSVIVGSISPSSNYRQVQNTHQHPRYDPNGFKDDIGFIQGDSGAPIVCNGKLTAILGTSMTTTIDMAATVVLVAPYQRWIGDRTY